MKMFVMSLIVIMGFAAQAQDVGVVLGIRGDSADAKTTNQKTQGKTNFQAGAVAKFEVHEAWQVRTGFLYTQRFYEFSSSSNNLGDAKFTYFEIPVGLMYKFSDFGGAFVGPNLAFNIAKDCPGGTCQGVSSAPIGLQVGASFKFAPQMGFEFYYETMFSKVADEVENPRAIIANFMITFD
ncbi:MAG: outer membrane beta-barrel protein [Bdellovibrio sp.]|jgi:hypothetical protein